MANAGNEKVPFLKLFSFADGVDKALMTTGTFGAVLTGLAQPFMTVIMGQLINTFGANMMDKSQILHDVGQVSLKLVILGVCACISSFLQMSCWMVTGERQAARIRGLYLKTILRQDIGFFDTETSTGEVIGRMSGDTILIQEAMGEKVGKFIQFSSTFIGGFVIAFVKGWLLALVLTACIPVLVVSGAVMSLLMARMASYGQLAYAEAGNVLEQTVGGIRTVASFTGEKIAIENYNKKLQSAYKAAVKQGLTSGVGLGVLLLTLFSIYGLAIYYGARLNVEKGYNGGTIINVMMAIMIGGMSLGQTSPSLSAFAAGQAAAFKMFETIKRKPKIDSYDSSGIVLENVKGEIELKDVYFRYPARPEVQIFSGFSLSIPSGNTVALVGQSGSGKSTVIGLLERFYDPEAGEVLIDGVDLKKMKLSWLRQQLGLVSQEPILFATSIKENILYGKDNATDSEIRTAIELANAAKFIDKLPLGLETMVGEHGTQLSGGQKQRIAIARAILKNPRILLLDEATSALDAESERIVQVALDNAMSNRTTVVVAHRLTTIRNAHLIAVVQSGKLVEQGTHADLIRDPDGAYSQLVRMQAGSSRETEVSEGGVDVDEVDVSLDDDIRVSRNASQRLSMIKSRSKGSSSSRGSFSFSYGIPGGVGIYTTEVGEEDTGDEDNSGVDIPTHNVSLKRLVGLNKPETPQLVLGSVAAMAHGVVFPIFGLLLSEAIKIMYFPPHQMLHDSRIWSISFVCLGIMVLLVVPLQNYLFGIAGGKLIERVRSLSFEKVVHQNIGWFDDSNNSSGAIGARLSGDASTLRSMVGDTLALIVQNISTVATGIIISFTANWILAFIILGALPLIGLQGFIQMKFYKGFSADAKVMYEEASQIANDAVGSIRTVASFCAEEKVMQTYQKKCEGPVKQGVKLGIVSGAGLAVGNLANYGATAFCFYIGAVLVFHGKATFGDVFRVFFSLTMAATGVSQTMALAPDVNKTKRSAASIFQILDSKPKIDSSSDKGQIPERVSGNIELQHISFKYPTRPNIPIFKDLCLSIPSGKTVALVGESGSGKSTVISLVERFYDPDSGQIYLDGVELRRLKISWLRQQMGLVSQEPVLFNETIRTNIAYGKQGHASEEEIISATKASNAHNFISSLPNGYDTSVGERGVQLSGGQKQRIAIARAILKDPRILLLDEATSALDTESERIVQDALDQVMVNRTSIVVAHRLSTIKGADVIAMVKNGVVAEKGKHDELMNLENGVYASLVALQSAAA